MKAACLITAVGLLFAGGASAQQPIATSAPETHPQDLRTATPAEAPLDDHRCLRHTGSLITTSRNQRDERRAPTSTTSKNKPRCAPVAGRAWSREDLERTGANNVADALRMLDPSVY